MTRMRVASCQQWAELRRRKVKRAYKNRQWEKLMALSTQSAIMLSSREIQEKLEHLATELEEAKAAEAAEAARRAAEVQRAAEAERARLAELKAATKKRLEREEKERSKGKGLAREKELTRDGGEGSEPEAGGSGAGGRGPCARCIRYGEVALCRYPPTDEGGKAKSCGPCRVAKVGCHQPGEEPAKRRRKGSGDDAVETKKESVKRKWLETPQDSDEEAMIGGILARMEELGEVMNAVRKDTQQLRQEVAAIKRLLEEIYWVLDPTYTRESSQASEEIVEEDVEDMHDIDMDA
ncbi:hypothetical protein BV22DRAFT_1051042 [Leucogyrophana mollusca]|uniref:Uncharacterized protein n=1 Tax=Leucogyrophana mollusca TaxID=85980 RepID=A0ACB8B185_9AGAM|nr:hypothetical protein BV22DRAFT_1051042 [Leucogyrophana mollusca]